MDENQKFEQIWGFRRNIDSSSDDSKSNSNTNHFQEKLDSVSPETDRVSETVQLEKKPKRARKNTPKKEKENKEKKKREVKSKSKKDSCASSNIKKKDNSSSSRKKKSKFLSQMTVSDDFRIFTESILDDLRVARETMFDKMRKEMDQIIKSKSSSRSRKKTVNGNNPTKNQNQFQNQKPQSRKRKTAQEKPKKGLEHPQEHVNNEETKEPNSKNPILIDSCGKKPIFTNTQDQIVASSYLTLPLVLPNSRSNETSLKLERGNYSGLQEEERFQSFGHNNTDGYPIGLNNHQRFNILNSFGIPNRVTQGFSDDGNLLGTRMMMNGGIRYNNTMPNHLTSSGFRNIYPN